MSIPGSASPLFFQTAAADAAGAGPIKSVRFNKADSAYLNKSFSTTGNQKTFTISLWIKKCLNTTSQYLFTSEHTGGDYFEFTSNADQIQVYNNASTAVNVKLERKLRDPSAWYHLVLAVDTTQATESDRLKIYINGEHQTDYASGGSTFPAQNYTFDLPSSRDRQIGAANFSGSLQGYFDGYMADFYFIDGAAKNVTDFGAFDDNGVWQAAAYSGTFGTNGFHLFDFANESGIGNDSSGNDNDFTVNNIASGDTALFTGGTYTTSDLWSGSGSASDSNFHDSNAGTGVGTDTDAAAFIKNNLGSSRYITSIVVGYGSDSIATGSWGTGYIDGAVVEGSNDDSSYTSIGTCTATTNDQEFSVNARYQYIRIRMADNYLGVGTFKINVTGNPNNDVVRDVPTNGSSDDDTGAGGEVSGNYCTMNPLASYLTLANGNLDVSQSSAAHHPSFGTLGVSSGKWYWEITKNDGSFSANTSTGLGVGKASFTSDGSTYISSSDCNIAYMQTGVQLYDGSDGYERVITALGSGVEHTAGTWMFAFDFDSGKGWVGKNGTWLSDTTAGNEGDPANGTNPCFNAFDSGAFYVPIVGMYAATSVSANFGQRAWNYAAPSGFKALCTANLPDPTIADGSDYFDAALWTGNGTSQSITGLEFSPDFVWVKGRNAANGHNLQNIISGTGKFLQTHTKSAEGSNTTKITAFNSDGFSLGSNAGVNNNNDTYVGWAWDAGSSTVTNTDGSVDSEVRANTTAGFSIVTYDAEPLGAKTIGHGLGAAPDMVIVKNRSSSTFDWAVYHSGLPANEALKLNTTDTYSSVPDYFDAPTSTVFSVSSSSAVGGGSGHEMLAFCFSAVAGYSLFGSYNGNSNDNGPFVYTGFRPSWLLIKIADGTNDWVIHDNKRDAFNPSDSVLKPNSSGSEDTSSSNHVDFLSNGFKIRNSQSKWNAGYSYVYAAFAENPFQANGGLAR